MGTITVVDKTPSDARHATALMITMRERCDDDSKRLTPRKFPSLRHEDYLLLCVSHSRSAARTTILRLSSARHPFVFGDAPSRESILRVEFGDGHGTLVRLHV